MRSGRKKGRPEGREHDHWQRASREIEAEREPGAPAREAASVGSASTLEPGGTIPGDSPAAGMGSIGTGGGSTGGASTGAAKKTRGR